MCVRYYACLADLSGNFLKLLQAGGRPCFRHPLRQAKWGRSARFGRDTGQNSRGNNALDKAYRRFTAVIAPFSGVMYNTPFGESDSQPPSG